MKGCLEKPGSEIIGILAGLYRMLCGGFLSILLGAAGAQL
jgi:hypothetical protein